MSKKKKRKFGNPATEAERVSRAAAISSEPEETPRPAQEPSHPPEGTISTAAVVAENQMLRNAYQALQDQSVDLAADFNRVLQSYAALVTNSFKLSSCLLYTSDAADE